MIDVGLAAQVEKLARVTAERLHVAPLPLRVDRVEGEAGLAAAAQPRDHGQLVAWEIDIDILQIMLARAADLDVGGASTFLNCSGEDAVRGGIPSRRLM